MALSFHPPAAAFLLAMLATHPASAETALPDITRFEAMQLKNACSADIARFCAKVKPGEGRIARCMLPHKAEISGPCRAKVKEVMEK
ncbi:cysteine rich repeat-containing protein [Acuticoccus sp. MNP-M23]|uniref:cysteine rich repeat-containing protein n=1 Tax=Acuticoccus sp. MNP-M23 TaxID=3072793 RepID=UPI0028158087|nr:cysteine rich repeat-containing protein [Acuticoccus sp. MNP-M23]WMS43889.1 cysteine rich repeat-containing protein [Acuticoccus sp. MNP-M23]